MRFRRCVLPLVVFSLLADGCAKRETPAEEGLRTHTLLIGNQNEPATLDPQIYDAATDYNIIGALFELECAGLITWDEEALVVYINGWALKHAAPGFLTQIAWRAQATKWPDTGPRASLERELETVKQQGRKRLQLVAQNGADVDGPARIVAVRR